MYLDTRITHISKEMRYLFKNKICRLKIWCVLMVKFWQTLVESGSLSIHYTWARIQPSTPAGPGSLYYQPKQKALHKRKKNPLKLQIKLQKNDTIIFVASSLIWPQYSNEPLIPVTRIVSSKKICTFPSGSICFPQVFFGTHHVAPTTPLSGTLWA